MTQTVYAALVYELFEEAVDPDFNYDTYPEVGEILAIGFQMRESPEECCAALLAAYIDPKDAPLMDAIRKMMSHKTN